MKIPNKKEKHPKTIPIHTSTIHHPFKLDQKKVKSPIGQGQADVQKAPQRGRARPEKIRTFFVRYGSGDHTKKSPMKRWHISTVFAKKDTDSMGVKNERPQNPHQKSSKFPWLTGATCGFWASLAELRTAESKLQAFRPNSWLSEGKRWTNTSQDHIK